MRLPPTHYDIYDTYTYYDTSETTPKPEVLATSSYKTIQTTKAWTSTSAWQELIKPMTTMETTTTAKPTTTETATTMTSSWLNKATTMLTTADWKTTEDHESHYPDYNKYFPPTTFATPVETTATTTNAAMMNLEEKDTQYYSMGELTWSLVTDMFGGKGHELALTQDQYAEIYFVVCLKLIFSISLFMLSGCVKVTVKGIYATITNKDEEACCKVAGKDKDKKSKKSGKNKDVNIPHDKHISMVQLPTKAEEFDDDYGFATIKRNSKIRGSRTYYVPAESPDRFCFSPTFDHTPHVHVPDSDEFPVPPPPTQTWERQGSLRTITPSTTTLENPNCIISTDSVKIINAKLTAKPITV